MALLSIGSSFAKGKSNEVGKNRSREVISVVKGPAEASIFKLFLTPFIDYKSITPMLDRETQTFGFITQRSMLDSSL